MTESYKPFSVDEIKALQTAPSMIETALALGGVEVNPADLPNALMEISQAEQALQRAATPEQSKAVESMAAAAKAWAKEQGDFEMVVAAARIYILARRKTTELSMPFAPEHGGDRRSTQFQVDNDVDLKLEFGFTQKQWERRVKELEITEDDIDNYFDECIEMHVEPTAFGLIQCGKGIFGKDKSDEWYTPAIYIESVRKVLGRIDLDPASCAKANETVKAAKFYSEADNGLMQPWHGRVFMNPPYSLNAGFTEKIFKEYDNGNVTEAIVLLSAHAVETKWFVPYWDCTLCFTGCRLKFISPTGLAVSGNISGSVFIHLGKDGRKFAEEFNKHGFVVRRWPE